MARTRAVAAPKVIDIAEARAQQRLQGYARRLSGVLADNKAVIADLYATGTLFTRRGTRAGRDLLLAHHHLLRMGDVLTKLQLQGKADGATDPAKVAQICGRLDALLERSAALTLDSQGRSAR